MRQSQQQQQVNMYAAHNI